MSVVTATSYKRNFFYSMSRHRPSRTDSSNIVLLLENITTQQCLKKEKWKIFLRDKKEEQNKPWQYLKSRIGQTSYDNRAKPRKDRCSCIKIYLMDLLKFQPVLTHQIGLQNAESVRDRTLHVFIFPEYS